MGVEFQSHLKGSFWIWYKKRQLLMDIVKSCVSKTLVCVKSTWRIFLKMQIPDLIPDLDIIEFWFNNIKVETRKENFK